MPIYENFISYRRTETLLEVKNIYDSLRERGFSAFCDIYSLDNGNFDEKLIESVRLCTNYILVINNRSLDRCAEEGDWLLREIRTALSYNRNIVLVFVGEVDFKNLPAEIDELRYKNGVKFDVRYYSSFIDELTGRFLVSDDEWARSEEGDFVFEEDTLISYLGSSKYVVIPEKTKRIAPSVFKDNTTVKEVRFPDGLYEIGERAFERCLSLTHIELPDGLKRLGKRAFARCYNLLNVQLNADLEVMEEECLAFCTGLKSVLIPAALRELHFSAFDNCNTLSKFLIDSKNTEFAVCDDILYSGDGAVLIRCPLKYRSSAVIVPDTVAEIGNGAFSGCATLTEVILPEGLRRIGDCAFSECANIMFLKLPRTLAELGEDAFRGWGRDRDIDFTDVSDEGVRSALNALTADGKGESFHLSSEYILVKTTFESENEAANMARGLLKNKLIVSGQITNLRSIYSWDNVISDEHEFELSCITRGDIYAEVERYIMSHHSFELCELMVIPVVHAPDGFGGWITDYVKKK